MSRGIVESIARAGDAVASNPIIVLMARRTRYCFLGLLCLAALCRVPVNLGQTHGNVVTSVNKLMFHGGRERLGWNPLETELTPATVASPAFGPLWTSPAFDGLVIAGTTYLPHLYASLLYADDVAISAGPQAGASFRTIFAATSNGYVYAVNGFATAGASPLPAGAILWSRRLCAPAINPYLDGGVPVGILGTPAIDMDRAPPRLYAACNDRASGWQLFALDLTNGKILPGWPVAISDAALATVNRNGPAQFQEAVHMSQRGALNLSPDGALLYVPFGSYDDKAGGWMVAIDTDARHIAAAFSGAPSTQMTANGGMWAAGGPAVDASGLVYATTGNSPDGSGSADGVWGQSLLVWDRMLHLVGTYTPFDYCQWDTNDIDLGGDSPLLVPDLDPASTATAYLVAFGSKQGSVYLVDRDHLPGRLDHRPPCSTNPATDQSLLPPGPQPQFGARGPLQVFRPYSELFGSIDLAKMRSTPAYFQGASGTSYLFVAGSTKAVANQPDVIPPSLTRLKIVTRPPPGGGPFLVPPGSRSARAILLSGPAAPAYLSIDGADNNIRFLSPGSPVVSSNGARDAIVWVLDANQFRSQVLVDDTTVHPVLYAIDATTMSPLWHSGPAQLHVGGKYNTPLIAHGVLFAGTDRVQAFGLH